MARRFSFLSSSGESIIPVSDGDFFTDDLTVGNAVAEFYIEFYSDAAGEAAVTPTGGTITVAGTPLGNVYLTDTNTTTIQASSVSTPTGTYTPPTVDGLSIKARMTLTGITGATHCRAILFKRGS